LGCLWHGLGVYHGHCAELPELVIRPNQYAKVKAMPVITCIDDLKRLHKRRTPKMFYDYAESGSYSEQTFRENTTDFAMLRLRQKVAVDMTGRSTKTTMIGTEIAMPVALAPVGMTGMQCADGEIKAARAAEKFGVPFTLSTMSICSIEDIAEHTTAPFWFQLYVMRDQDFVAGMIERAKKAKCSALVLTLDLQILGQRHKDIKNDLTAPPRLTLKNILNIATKPRWALGMLGTKRRTFRNIVGHAKDVGNLRALHSWTNEQFDPQLDWDKVRKIKDAWGGKLILKGILDVEDARRAADFGADAIIVSNHGGRQLDGALSAIRMLPSIVRAVGDRVEVHMDSGIRSGQDVLKALALGAKSTYIGRSFIYGLGAMGEAGVTRALEVLQKELDITMALCGERDVRALGRHNLMIPKDFEGDWAL
jgi:L-lactate dehydrogenase (cytochrome)